MNLLLLRHISHVPIFHMRSTAPNLYTPQCSHRPPCSVLNNMLSLAFANATKSCLSLAVMACSFLSLVTFLFFFVEKKRGCFPEFWFGAIFLLTGCILVSMCASDFSALVTCT